MSYWIYKCNSKNQRHQVDHGDWERFFSRGRAGEWGTTDLVPALHQLKVGDTILAHQSDRNELVGVARVTEMTRRRKCLAVILAPVEREGVKVRPSKKSDSRIAGIDALMPGKVKTIYDISANDARHLLKVAKARSGRG